MNTLTRWLLISLSLLAACPVLRGQAASPEQNPAERVIRNHAAYLNELSDRRRLNTFFPNEQSAFYGVPIRYVNSYRGNFTFVRRDLVTADRIPIVLARVYDSSIRTDSGFGPGWHLSLAETMVRHPNDTVSYVDDSASELILVRRGSGYAPRDPGPTDIASIEARDDALRVIYRSGWTKQFKRNADRFVLVAIRDPHGNTLTLRYRDKQLSRIEAQNGRFVAVEWDQSERIGHIADDQGRAVSYAYDGLGRLEAVTDLGGNRWRYEYDHLGRLKRVIDPRNVTTLEAAFDSDSRARSVQILGAQYQYKYEEAGTLITDEANRVTRISHNRYGIATSVSNPVGFVSEVRLDEQNRVTTLLHKGAPRATFTYGPGGWVDTLTRFDDSGVVALAYEYDDAGRATRITGTDGSRLMLEYNASGDLLRKTEGEATLEYEYTAQGDLRSVTQAGETTLYMQNSDGQIETIKSPRGDTQLIYFPDGKLKSIRFADGAVHEYRYNTLGFRQEVERSDDTEIYYWYDVAGNLIRSDGLNANGAVAGQTFDMNDNNQAEIIRFAAGDSVRVTYDASGNPETITASDPEAPALEYLYDSTDRLVAVQDGEAISGSYLYEDTEPDLRLQLDDRTMRVGASALRQSATLGNILSVAYTRPYGSILGTVRFDEATRAFDLPSDFGLYPPDAVTRNSLTRRKLVDVDKGDVEARINFDRPSNVMYLPAEYATINCASCVFTGVILRGNGVTGTLSVPYGSTVTLVASKTPASTCPDANIFYDWTINGGVMPWDGGGPQFHTFTAPGTHLVRVQGECTPCDVIRVATLTVNVAPCSAGVSLQTQTEATIPSNTARTKLGIGERVTLSLSPAPPCSVTWSKTGNGSLSATSGNSITFTAHERASTTTVTANIGGVQRSITYTVVEPASESAIKLGDQTFPAGVQGAGMDLLITVAPTDVSFAKVEVREVPGPATNITGYFTTHTPPAHSPNPLWITLSANNKWEDDAHFNNWPSPWTTGGWQWNIPVRWRVVGSTSDAALPNRLQVFSINNTAGSSTVTKLGQSATRSP